MTVPDQTSQNPDAMNDRIGYTEMHDALMAISDRLAFPPTPDIAVAVRTAIETEPIPVGRRDTPLPLMPFRQYSPRHWMILAAVLALLVVGTVAIIRPTRETVAGWLGVPGIHIVFDDDDPTPTPVGELPPATPLPDIGLLLGESVTLEEAQRRVDFAIAVPVVPGLGPPDEIYLRERPGADQVTFLYRPRPGIPAAVETGIGLLLVQFEADDEAMWSVKKYTRGTDVRVVRLGGREALWIGGSHELLIYPDPANVLMNAPEPGTPTVRQSANVLLWANDGITYRLETALPLDDALRIAESTQPTPDSTPTP